MIRTILNVNSDVYCGLLVANQVDGLERLANGIKSKLNEIKKVKPADVSLSRLGQVNQGFFRLLFFYGLRLL